MHEHEERSGNPFQNTGYRDQTDIELIEFAVAGRRESLEALIKRHQPFIYNLAWKMVHDPDDAWDLTQEALIKVVTNLAKFQKKSSFRTWLYRIVVNHFLETKRRKRETFVSDFVRFGDNLDSIPNEEMDEMEQAENAAYIEEMKIQCMSGMLLCLNRDQRMVYILGEVFNADHTIGSEILDISKNNFRTRLSRARRDLYNFMNNKCGLVNKANPCRCRKKTRFAIDNGFMDPQNLKFNLGGEKRFNEVFAGRAEKADHVIDDKYMELFRSHRFSSTKDREQFLEKILDDDSIRHLFDLG